MYGRTPKWTFEVGACGTPTRRRSRRLLWRSPLAWNTCAATDCDALRSIIGFVRASSGFFFFRFGALLHLLLVRVRVCQAALVFATSASFQRFQYRRMTCNVRCAKRVAITSDNIIATALIGPIFSRIKRILSWLTRNMSISLLNILLFLICSSTHLSWMIAIALIVFWIVRPAETSTKPKVSQLNMTVTINKNVVWLDITVNKTHFMYAFHSAY